MKTKLVLRVPESVWTTIEEAAAAHADTFPVNSHSRGEIYRALNCVQSIKPRVRIEVIGGVADVTRCTPGVDVTIKDHDNHA